MFNREDTVEKQLADGFVCGKCKSHGANVERLAMTGAGMSRLINYQSHVYLFASCLNCGFTEIYSAKVLEGTRQRGMDILDAVMGG